MKIVTAKEVASFLKLTESTVYTLASEGQLSGFRIGNSWRFDMDEILKQIKDSKGGRGEKGKRRPRVRERKEV